MQPQPQPSDSPLSTLSDEKLILRALADRLDQLSDRPLCLAADDPLINELFEMLTASCPRHRYRAD